MHIKRTKHSILFRAITIVLVCLFIANDSIFALSAGPLESSRSALAPYLATRQQGNTLLHNEWIVAEIGRVIYPILKLAKEGKLQNPINVLTPSIRKHLCNIDGEAKILLEAYDIDSIEQVRDGAEIIGFSLPVTRKNKAYKLVYNLQGGDITIPMKDGTKVYVRAEAVQNTPQVGAIPQGDTLQTQQADTDGVSPDRMAPDVNIVFANPNKASFDSFDIKKFIEDTPCPKRREHYAAWAEEAKSGNEAALRKLEEAALCDEVLSVMVYGLLVEIGNPHSIPVFVAGLDSAYMMVRNYAETGLRNLGETGSRVMIEMLKSGDVKKITCALNILRGRPITREEILQGELRRDNDEGLGDLEFLEVIEEIYPTLPETVQRLAESTYTAVGVRGYAPPKGQRYVSKGTFKHLYSKLQDPLKERLKENIPVIVVDEGASDLSATAELWKWCEEEFAGASNIHVIGSDLFMDFYVLTPASADKAGFDSCIVDALGNVIQLKVGGAFICGAAIKERFQSLKKELESVFSEVDRTALDASAKGKTMEFISGSTAYRLRKGQFVNPRAQRAMSESHGRFSCRTHDIFSPLREKADVILILNTILPEIFDRAKIEKILRAQEGSLKEGGYLVAGYQSRDYSPLEFRPSSNITEDGTILNYIIYRREGDMLRVHYIKNNGMGLSEEENLLDVALKADADRPEVGTTPQRDALRVQQADTARVSPDRMAPDVAPDAEAEETLKALEMAGGKKTEAARMLGISPSTMSIRMKNIRKDAVENNDTATLERIEKASVKLPYYTEETLSALEASEGNKTKAGVMLHKKKATIIYRIKKIREAAVKKGDTAVLERLDKALASFKEKTLRALEASGGSQKKAAEMLGISPSAMSVRMKNIRKYATEEGDTATLERIEKVLVKLPYYTEETLSALEAARGSQKKAAAMLNITQTSISRRIKRTREAAVKNGDTATLERLDKALALKKEAPKSSAVRAGEDRERDSVSAAVTAAPETPLAPETEAGAIPQGDTLQAQQADTDGVSPDRMAPDGMAPDVDGAPDGRDRIAPDGRRLSTDTRGTAFVTKPNLSVTEAMTPKNRFGNIRIRIRRIFGRGEEPVVANLDRIATEAIDKDTFKILFLCAANYDRSPALELITKYRIKENGWDEWIKVSSRGANIFIDKLGFHPSQLARDIAKSCGVPQGEINVFCKHKKIEKFGKGDAMDADIIIISDGSQLRYIKKKYPDALNKVVYFGSFNEDFFKGRLDFIERPMLGYNAQAAAGMTGLMSYLEMLVRERASFLGLAAPAAPETPLAPAAITPDSERVHATNFQDALTYIQAQQASFTNDERRTTLRQAQGRPERSRGTTNDENKPLILALGTSWIKGYERDEYGRSFRYLQGKDLNELIISIRNYCESKGIPFIDSDDAKLLARINAEKAKEGMSNAKVIVLAGENTVKSDDFAGLRNDKKNAFVVGVNNQELTAGSYVRLIEILAITLKLFNGFDVPQTTTPIKIVMDDNLHIYILTPPAQPMPYEEQRLMYEVQWNA